MTRLFALLMTAIGLVPATFAQGLFGARPRPVHHSPGTQWYVGVTTGMNHSRATVMQPYTEFSTIGGSPSAEKDYQKPGLLLGYEAGITATVAFTTFLQIGIATKYNQSTYAYHLEYAWNDPENPANQLLLDNEHRLSLHYLEMPVSLRYTIPISRLKPFVQVGIVYGRLTKAHKELIAISTDYASGEAVSAVRTHQTAEVSASYIKSRADYTLGGGLLYNFGGVMLMVDANYRRGFHNITDTKNRYTATRHLEGIGHISDDVKLSAISYAVSFLFPLKFITDKDFKPVIF